MTFKSVSRVLGAVVSSGIVPIGAMQAPAAESSAGALANSCGVPATPPPTGRRVQPVLDAAGNVYGADFLMNVRKFGKR
jgi:hypothetical protein